MKHRFVIPAFCLACMLMAVLAWWIMGWSGRNDGQPDSTPIVEKTARGNRSAMPSGSFDIDASKDGVTSVTHEIRALSRTDAVARISEILASGRDFDTGTEFTLDGDGNLIAAPTLRTMLLDEVASIDPAAAVRISRDILSTPTTADEWAIALRNIGRVENDAAARDYLIAKTEELIQNPKWQAAPSIGYLNAFDVLVHTGATESAPLLSSMIRNKDRRDLAHAAFLTLDRLVQRQPTEMLERMVTDTELTASRPEMAAQQFARGDLRHEPQREIVARWLLHPQRTATELNAFAGVFPNHNQFVSNNLLTRDTASAGADLAAHDREVLEIVTSWADDPAFKPLSEHLSVMISRLESFVNTSQTFSSAPNE